MIRHSCANDQHQQQLRLVHARKIGRHQRFSFQLQGMAHHLSGRHALSSSPVARDYRSPRNFIVKPPAIGRRKAPQKHPSPADWASLEQSPRSEHLRRFATNSGALRILPT